MKTTTTAIGTGVTPAANYVQAYSWNPFTNSLVLFFDRRKPDASAVVFVA
jgi:hypothetical protein